MGMNFDFEAKEVIKNHISAILLIIKLLIQY